MADALEQILGILGVHPLLSPYQLSLLLGCSERHALSLLQELKRRGSIRAYNARRDEIHARALYALTPQGAKEVGIPYSTGRLAWLLLLIERVFKCRLLLASLASGTPSGWQLSGWNVEVKVPLRVLPPRASQERRHQWVAHAIAQWHHAHGGQTTMIVELDVQRGPVEVEYSRLKNLVWSRNVAEMVLVILAADDLRLQEYYTFLRAAALAKRMALPHAYLSTLPRAAAVLRNPQAPAWYSTFSHRWGVALLADLDPQVATPLVSWQLLECPTARTTLTLSPWQGEMRERPALMDLARLVLSLSPLEKRILDELARHPFLNLDNLRLLLTDSWRLPHSLQRMRQWGLVEVHALPESGEEVYGLGEHGIRYLAAINGFGKSYRVYMRARGWGRGFRVLLARWRHTRAENTFFLQLASIAQRRGHTLTWLSELEARLYFEYSDARGHHRRSFLPDGRGTYIAGERRYDFALEIDRTRANTTRWRRKVASYYAVIQSALLRDRQGPLNFRLLVVTSSWERADTLRRVVFAVMRETGVREPLQMFITTFDMLQVRSVDAPIWLPVDLPDQRMAGEIPKTYCLECFAPEPPAPRRTSYAPPTYATPPH